MAESDTAATAADGSAVKRHDLRSILAPEGRDYLVRNNGDQFKVSTLEGKFVGLYFSASWCDHCRRFTPALVDSYNEIASAHHDFEVIFVSEDDDEESFQVYFSKMPWLAIPFSDSSCREQLKNLFGDPRIPHLVVLGKNGEVVSEEAVEAVIDYESEAYPFTKEKIEKLKLEAETAKKNQTLRGVLATRSRDFLISTNGDEVPISELEGKIVCLFFSMSSDDFCGDFLTKLIEMDDTLKKQGEAFEVVLISPEEDESSFRKEHANMPGWLAIPCNDKIIQRLSSYFEIVDTPALVIIGSDGKTLTTEGADLVEDHGPYAYPFSEEKLVELAEIEKARREAQSLESLLVSGEKDYVIGKDGVKVPVSELLGKNILLYFSAHWCPPCRALLPKLVDTYNDIKSKHAPNFELIFISLDHDQASFDDYFASMPWLALPFHDVRMRSLSRTFKISGIPSLVAIGPMGKTVSHNVVDLVTEYGAEVYPFTEEQVRQLEEAKGKPDGGGDKGDDNGVKIIENAQGCGCNGDVCNKV